MTQKRKIKQKRSATTQHIPAWLFFVTWVVMTGLLFHAGVMISNGLEYYLARLGIRLSVSSYFPGMLIPFGFLIAAQAFLLHLYAGWSAWRWLLISSAGLFAASLVETGLYLLQPYLYGADIYWLSWTVIHILAQLTLAGVQVGVLRDKVRRAWLWPLFMGGAFLAANIVNDLIVNSGMEYNQAAEIAVYGVFAVLSGAGMSYLLHYQRRSERHPSADAKVIA
jgi:hypothetical protein